MRDFTYIHSQTAYFYYVTQFLAITLHHINSNLRMGIVHCQFQALSTQLKGQNHNYCSSKQLHDVNSLQHIREIILKFYQLAGKEVGTHLFVTITASATAMLYFMPFH